LVPDKRHPIPTGGIFARFDAGGLAEFIVRPGGAGITITGSKDRRVRLRRIAEPSRAGNPLMHWLDVTLLALLAIGAGLGFWSGLIMQVARLLSFGLSIYLTFLLNEPVTRLLHERVAPEANVNLLHGIAYIVVFLVVYVALFALSRLIYKIVRATKLEPLDRLGGAVLGAFKMTLVLAPLCALLAILSLPTTDAWMSQSKIAPVLAKGLHVALVLVPENYKTQAQESVDHVRDQLQHQVIEEALKK
jgi:membrane protein required for colicin V production